MITRSVVLLLSVPIALGCGDWNLSAASLEGVTGMGPFHFVTNVAQFRTLSGADYPAGCDSHLTGVLTLGDTNCGLAVLQDATGAVALNFRVREQPLRVGQIVAVKGTDCCPYFAGFSDYPHRPSNWDTGSSFEVPMNPREYELTRLRGFCTRQYWASTASGSPVTTRRSCG